ncbi:PREDICTED: uncharacterized protein LOC106872646 [Paramuricea clavata]|uniref:XK-related protein n=1 Tax=Paramuricea clavata TaxID=317549 RepID=A0A7D9L6E3_PARCT|nr:PREDICTED: uncharacterized protein LOC106872646 [Paramuricea clavata]
MFPILFGVIIYLLELALNLNAFMQHALNTSSESAFGILGILIISTLLVNIVAIVNRAGKISPCFYGMAFVIQGCVILRYFEEWREGEDEDRRNRKLIRLRFSQALLNSAPQCIVQFYIMVELWSLPSYAVASLAVSFISLLWGFASVTPSDYLLGTSEEDDQPSQPLTFCSSVLFIGQVGFLISRLVLFSFFAYSFRHYLLFVFSVRMIVVHFFAYGLALYFVFCHFCIQCSDCCRDIKTLAFSVWNKTITLLVSIFDVTICYHGYAWFIILHFLENIAMFCVQMWADPICSDNIGTLRFLTLCVVLGGFGVGCVFSGVVQCCCIDDDEPIETYSRSSNVPRYPSVATTRVREDPSPPPATAYVIKTERIFMQGPSHEAIVEKTEVIEIKR